MVVPDGNGGVDYPWTWKCDVPLRWGKGSVGRKAVLT